MHARAAKVPTHSQQQLDCHTCTLPHSSHIPRTATSPAAPCRRWGVLTHSQNLACTRSQNHLLHSSHSPQHQHPTLSSSVTSPLGLFTDTHAHALKHSSSPPLPSLPLSIALLQTQTPCAHLLQQRHVAVGGVHRQVEEAHAAHGSHALHTAAARACGGGRQLRRDVRAEALRRKPRVSLQRRAAESLKGWQAATEEKLVPFMSCMGSGAHGRAGGSAAHRAAP